jgi:uncharacterized protein YggT (Ycf19 family)
MMFYLISFIISLCVWAIFFYIETHIVVSVYIPDSSYRRHYVKNRVKIYEPLVAFLTSMIPVIGGCIALIFVVLLIIKLDDSEHDRLVPGRRIRKILKFLDKDI